MGIVEGTGGGYCRGNRGWVLKGEQGVGIVRGTRGGYRRGNRGWVL